MEHAGGSPHSSNEAAATARSQSPDSSNGNEDGGVAARGSGKVPGQAASRIESENDLKQFLKVARPDWSLSKRHGHSNIQRVIDKLKDIGVVDTWELIRRVSENTINEDLSTAGHSRFSRDTLERIRRQSCFIRSLEHSKEPYYRQTGLFAPVPQMLCGTNLRHKHTDDKSNKKEATTDPGMNDPIDLREDRPNTVSNLNAMGLGDHGGVFIRGSGGRTTSESLRDLLTGGAGNAQGTLYLRNARPRHGRTKHTQSRPMTVQHTMSAPRLSTPQWPKWLSAGSSSSSAIEPWSLESSSVAGSMDFTEGGLSSSPSWPRQSDGYGSCNNSCGDDNEWDTQQLRKWSRVGNQMSQNPWVAKWCNRGKNALLRQGEAMLSEQAALQERRDLVKVIESQGEDSPMRRHIATKIRTRLKEEKKRDDQEMLDTQQRCMNIRKSLGYMQATRRELSEQKRKAQDVLVGPVAKENQFGLSADLFQKAKAQPTTVETEELQSD